MSRNKINSNSIANNAIQSKHLSAGFGFLAKDTVLAESVNYDFRADIDYAGDVINANFFNKPCYDPKIVNTGLSWFPTDANLAVVIDTVTPSVIFIDRSSGTAVKTLTGSDWSWLTGKTFQCIVFKYGVVAIGTTAGVGAIDLRNGSLVYRDWDLTLITDLSIVDLDLGLGGPNNIVDGNGIRPCIAGSYGAGVDSTFIIKDDWHTSYDHVGSAAAAGQGSVAIIAGRVVYNRLATTNEVRGSKSYSFLLDITGDDWNEDNGAATASGAVFGKGAEHFLKSNGINTYVSGSDEGVDVMYVSPRNKLDHMVGFTMDETRMFSLCGNLRSAWFVDSVTADRGPDGGTLTETGSVTIETAVGSGTRKMFSGFGPSVFAYQDANVSNGTIPFGFSIDFKSNGTLNNTHNVLLNWHHASSDNPRVYISLHTSGILAGAGDRGGATTVAGPTFGPTVAQLNDDPDTWHNVTVIIVPGVGVLANFDGGPWKLGGNPLFVNTMNTISGTNTLKIGESITNASYGFTSSLPFGGKIGEISYFKGSKPFSPDAIQWWAHNRIASYANVQCVTPANEAAVWGAYDRSAVGNGIRAIVGGATKVFKIGDGMAVTNIDQTALDGGAGINASTVGGYIARGEYGLLSAIGEVYQNTDAKDVEHGLVGVGHNGGPRWLDGVGTVGIDAYMLTAKSNVTGDSTNYTVPFDTVVLQNGLILNTATGQMIALVSGWYLIHGNLDIEGWDASTTRVAAWVYYNTTNFLFAVHDLTWNFAGSERILGGSADRRWLNAGDYIELKAYATGGAKIADVTSGGAINRQTTLSAHLVG